MKPWEENWTADGGHVRVPDGGSDGFFGDTDVCGGESCPSICLDAMEEDEARAMLASASPEMYQALEALVSLPFFPELGDLVKARDAAHAALRKARGERR